MDNTKISMHEWQQVRGRWTVKCIDDACVKWGGFHEPDRADDGHTFITHFDRSGSQWKRPCVAPVAAFAQMDAVPIVAAMRDVPEERRMNAVAVAVDAFCQTGGLQDWGKCAICGKPGSGIHEDLRGDDAICANHVVR